MSENNGNEWTCLPRKVYNPGEQGEVMECFDDILPADQYNLAERSDIKPITPSEARWVLWKIDLIILALITGTVILSAVDKVIVRMRRSMA
jgi:hypothetical protein